MQFFFIYTTNINIFLVLKRSIAFVITKESGLNNNSYTGTHSNLSPNGSAINIRDPKTKFCIGEISVENHWLSSMYWALDT